MKRRFVGIYGRAGCREKLEWLLGRLTQLLAEDGRRPTNIKVPYTYLPQNSRYLPTVPTYVIICGSESRLSSLCESGANSGSRPEIFFKFKFKKLYDILIVES